jgi:hypothetical protein
MPSNSQLYTNGTPISEGGVGAAAGGYVDAAAAARGSVAVAVLDCSIVAIDAVHFPEVRLSTQLQPAVVARELNKALAGFTVVAPEVDIDRIATGNWGCGAFRGHLGLKAVVQWMAASQVCRDVAACRCREGVHGCV